MYEHILVPVSFDGDRHPETALEVASKLGTEGGKITLLHVMEQVPSYAVNYIPEGFHEDAKKAIIKSLEGMATGISNAECVVVDGHSGRTILDWADEHKPGLIVVASHRPGMQDLLLGSTATQLVRHAKCAVHVVR
ncbi:universal stress protein [Shimia sp. FJ5]|uniref:universal stress protein n=1 Tax=Shimia sp. FJ5 TaxID=3079054 RepID=UPI002618DFAC|nr:universal stress protein [Shimia sp. FJ5]MDV4145251.1 universal stress protein [Shimia sp. FJ5]